jgi:hypothetical protein
VLLPVNSIPPAFQYGYESRALGFHRRVSVGPRFNQAELGAQRVTIVCRAVMALPLDCYPQEGLLKVELEQPRRHVKARFFCAIGGLQIIGYCRIFGADLALSAAPESLDVAEGHELLVQLHLNPDLKPSVVHLFPLFLRHGQYTQALAITLADYLHLQNIALVVVQILIPDARFLRIIGAIRSREHLRVLKGCVVCVERIDQFLHLHVLIQNVVDVFLTYGICQRYVVQCHQVGIYARKFQIVPLVYRMGLYHDPRVRRLI